MLQVSDLSYASLSQRFVDVAPALRDEYRRMLDDWEDEVPGQTIVFDDVISPYLIGLLRSPMSNDVQLRRVFAFFEAMAQHEDQHVRDVLAVTVSEQILGEPEIYDIAQSLMGSTTRRIVDATATDMGVIAWKTVEAEEPNDPPRDA